MAKGYRSLAALFAGGSDGRQPVRAGLAPAGRPGRVISPRACWRRLPPPGTGRGCREPRSVPRRHRFRRRTPADWQRRAGWRDTEPAFRRAVRPLRPRAPAIAVEVEPDGRRERHLVAALAQLFVAVEHRVAPVCPSRWRRPPREKSPVGLRGRDRAPRPRALLNLEGGEVVSIPVARGASGGRRTSGRRRAVRASAAPDTSHNDASASLRRTRSSLVQST